VYAPASRTVVEKRATAGVIEITVRGSGLGLAIA